MTGLRWVRAVRLRDIVLKLYTTGWPRLSGVVTPSDNHSVRAESIWTTLSPKKPGIDGISYSRTRTVANIIFKAGSDRP